MAKLNKILVKTRPLTISGAHGFFIRIFSINAEKDFFKMYAPQKNIFALENKILLDDIFLNFLKTYICGEFGGCIAEFNAAKNINDIRNVLPINVFNELYEVFKEKLTYELKRNE